MATAIDDLWETVEGMAIPEGYRVEIIGGQIVVSPQSELQWRIIRILLRQFEHALGEDANIIVDVPVDFPGYRNGLAPDMALLPDAARPGAETKRFDWMDLDAAVEVVSPSSIDNDYNTKVELYGKYNVPVYLIVDPSTEQCTVLSNPAPRKGYTSRVGIPFGTPVELDLPDGRRVVLHTERFPRN